MRLGVNSNPRQQPARNRCCGIIAARRILIVGGPASSGFAKMKHGGVVAVGALAAFPSRSAIDSPRWRERYRKTPSSPHIASLSLFRRYLDVNGRHGINKRRPEMHLSLSWSASFSSPLHCNLLPEVEFPVDHSEGFFVAQSRRSLRPWVALRLWELWNPPTWLSWPCAWAATPRSENLGFTCFRRN